MKKRLSTIFGAVCLVIAVVAGGIFVGDAIRYNIAAQDFAAISDEYQAACETDDSNEEAADLAKGVKKLHKQNADCVGWIRVDDTRIDYPVMYTPGDYDYYLYRNFKKEYSDNGTPFVGDGCDIESPSTIIYGHNMNDGSMFSQLLKFEDPDFASEHCITLATQKGVATYRPLAAFYENLASSDCYKYWKSVGDLSKRERSKFLATVCDLSLYQTDVKVSEDSKLLTLSTCSGGADSERFVLVAVQS